MIPGLSRSFRALRAIRLPTTASLGSAAAMGACVGKASWQDPVIALPVGTLTSEVFTDIASVFPPGPTTFANYGWSIPHEGIRHELLRIEKAVGMMSGSDASFAAFLEYFETCSRALLEPCTLSARSPETEASILADRCTVCAKQM